MPQLIFFGSCQKAIIDKRDGSVSMITLLHSMKIQVPIGILVPEDAAASVTWATVATWFRSEEDEDKTFQPKIEILYPSGDVFLSIEGEPFILQEVSYTTTTNSNGFPIGQQGIYTIRVLLREVSEEKWEEKGSCPVEVSHIPLEGVQSEQ